MTRALVFFFCFTVLPFNIHHTPAFLFCAIPASLLHALLTTAWRGHLLRHVELVFNEQTLYHLKA